MLLNSEQIVATTYPNYFTAATINSVRLLELNL